MCETENVRRFVNLLDRATPAELGSPLTADDNVTEDFIVSRVSRVAPEQSYRY